MNLVVDSSALTAILLGEAEADQFLEKLADSGRIFMSAFSYLETAVVMEARKGPAGAGALAFLLAEAEVEMISFDSTQAEVALDAWRRFGKGRHPAGLNIGDCAAYALAKTLNRPLLFKGNDFNRTDLPAIAFKAE